MLVWEGVEVWTLVCVRIAVDDSYGRPRDYFPLNDERSLVPEWDFELFSVIAEIRVRASDVSRGVAIGSQPLLPKVWSPLQIEESARSRIPRRPVPPGA